MIKRLALWYSGLFIDDDSVSGDNTYKILGLVVVLVIVVFKSL